MVLLGVFVFLGGVMLFNLFVSLPVLEEQKQTETIGVDVEKIDALEVWVEKRASGREKSFDFAKDKYFVNE
jgi:hypothetical protein